MAGEDRRARIVRAAAELFMAHGYAGVSMDDVLGVVGGSKATLYRHFADKTDLFRSAVEMMIDERARPILAFTPDLDVDRAGEADAAGVLEAFGRHFADVVLQPGAIALHRLVTSEAERVDGLGQAFYRHGPVAGNAALGGFLRWLRELGVLDVPNPELAAAQLYQAMVGGLQLRLLINPAAQVGQEEIQESVTTAVQTFLRGRWIRVEPLPGPVTARRRRG
jgi:TetR/AcrR family transcriptional regulator, mexJK operon transcriptional repressor